MASPIVQLSNLTKIYKRSHLGKVYKTTGVNDVTLDIVQGEIFALLGLNGAGKTTTFKLILGLLFPTSGQISLFDTKMPNRQVLHQVGYLPEIPYFPRHLSVQEVLRFYGLLSDIAANDLSQRIEQVLKTVRMINNRKKLIRECSKGMLQRVSLAQALIHDPSLLILDEPITGLDPLGLSEMRELILELNANGKTILFSSHVIAEVEKIANRAAILVNGSLVKVIPQDQWQNRPGSLETVFVEHVKGSVLQ